MSEQYLLEMKGICKSFPGVKALQNVDLQLKAGEVHALLGENGAGKSTLIKVLGGIYHAEEGEIIIDGQKVNIDGVVAARHAGISIVHQELVLVPYMTVAENIFLGRYPIKKVLGLIPTVDHKKMYEDTAALLKRVRMDFDPKAQLGSLSVSQMQSVEIAKAVSANCKVLILDEPTSSLTQNEVEALFRIVDDLKAEGVAIVYISHKMDEILRISDEVTIMRDGQYIGTWEAKELTTDMIISRMDQPLSQARACSGRGRVLRRELHVHQPQELPQRVVRAAQGRNPRRRRSGRCAAHGADGGHFRHTVAYDRQDHLPRQGTENQPPEGRHRSGRRDADRGPAAERYHGRTVHCR